MAAAPGCCVLLGCLLAAASVAAAERVAVSYRAGEGESALSARAGALAKLRHAALPRLGVLLRGSTRLVDDHLLERIDVLAEGLVQFRHIEDRWEGSGPDRVLHLSAELLVDQDAIDRFHAAAVVEQGAQRPLDETLAVMRYRASEADADLQVLRQPWIDAIYEPLLSLPLQVDLVQLDLAPGGRSYVGRLRLTWTVPEAVRAALCGYLSCRRPDGDLLLARQPFSDAQQYAMGTTAVVSDRLVTWLHATNLYLRVSLGGSGVYHHPLFVSPPDNPHAGRDPALGHLAIHGLAKHLHAAGNVEAAFVVPASVVDQPAALRAWVSLD